MHTYCKDTSKIWPRSMAQRSQVEAAKEKGGVVAILEKQLAAQEEEEEAAKRLTERGGLPGSSGIRSAPNARPCCFSTSRAHSHA